MKQEFSERRCVRKWNLTLRSVLPNHLNTFIYFISFHSRMEILVSHCKREATTATSKETWWRQILLSIFFWLFFFSEKNKNISLLLQYYGWRILGSVFRKVQVTSTLLAGHSMRYTENLSRTEKKFMTLVREQPKCCFAHIKIEYNISLKCVHHQLG